MTFAAPASEATCKVCEGGFLRFKTTQSTCIPCVLKVANAKDKAVAKAQRQAAISARKQQKAERAQIRGRKEALKSRAEWMREAQSEVNRFVRLRDHGLPCVSCGTVWTDKAQAGHFLSRGARPELRFAESNLASQCVQCNLHRHGNQAMYRTGLIQRIGLEAVEALEGPHPAAKWTVEDLRAIRTTYRAKARALQVSKPT